MKVKEKVMEIVFLVAACVSILAVLLICVFLFSSGIPAIGKIGPLNFLGGTVWKPSNNLFGILPMILGSIMLQQGPSSLVFQLVYLWLFSWQGFARAACIKF